MPTMTALRGQDTFAIDEAQSEAKLRELILYVADKCASSSTFGKTALNKILWKADFEAFLYTGRPITGARYQSIEFGPAPKRMKPLLDEMAAADEIVVRSSTYGSFTQKRVIALRNANLSAFTGEQIAILDRVIAECVAKTGTQLSNESHGFAWQLGQRLSEGIPYQAAFLSDAPASTYHTERVRALAAEHRWAERYGWDSV